MSSKRIAAASGEAPETGDERKKAQIPVRTSARLRQRLIECATDADRSLTQEIEQRLERSFEQEAEVGGRRTQNFLRRLAATIVDIEDRLGGSWHSDLAAYYAVREAVSRIVSEYRPAYENEAALRSAIAEMDMKHQAAVTTLSPGLAALIQTGMQTKAAPAATADIPEEFAGVLLLLQPLLDAQAKGRQVALDAMER